MSAAAAIPTPIGTREALAHIGRGVRYAWPVRWLYLRKLIYGLVGIAPAVFLPWPGKVMVDHVILKGPLDASQYPFFFQPIVERLQGASPLEVVVTMGLILVTSLVVFGGWGTSGDQDKTGAGLHEVNAGAFGQRTHALPSNFSHAAPLFLEPSFAPRVPCEGPPAPHPGTGSR